jgi:hypothetical protein
MTNILFLDMFHQVPAGIKMFYYVTYTNTHAHTGILEEVTFVNINSSMIRLVGGNIVDRSTNFISTEKNNFLILFFIFSFRFEIANKQPSNSAAFAS